MEKLTVQIQNGTKGFEPVVVEGVTVQTERKGVPGKLTITLVQDKKLKVSEGNPIKVMVDGVPVFYGYVFRIERDQTVRVKVTAYDQIRYLKNKDTYVFKDTTASAIVSALAADYGIKTGEIEATTYMIPSLVEDNKSLLDMMQDAIAENTKNTKQLYILYDDCGKLCLKQLARMKVGLLIDEETASTFSYETNIDEETYNRIKLVYEDDKKNQRDVVTVAGASEGSWGTLQYFEKISKAETASAETKANTLLALYNHPKKTIKINDVLGDVRVRGGSMVMVKLDLVDHKINRWMMVSRCTHKFSEHNHLMDLVLEGGDFVG